MRAPQTTLSQKTVTSLDYQYSANNIQLPIFFKQNSITRSLQTACCYRLAGTHTHFSACFLPRCEDNQHLQTALHPHAECLSHMMLPCKPRRMNRLSGGDSTKQRFRVEICPTHLKLLHLTYMVHNEYIFK